MCFLYDRETKRENVTFYQHKIILSLIVEVGNFLWDALYVSWSKYLNRESKSRPKFSSNEVFKRPYLPCFSFLNSQRVIR